MKRLILTLIFLPSLSLAGVMNGGGGRGVLCNKGGHRKLEVLDLFEAREKLGLKITPNDFSFDRNVDIYGPRISENDSTTSQAGISLGDRRTWAHKLVKMAVLDLIDFIPAGQRLPLVDDSHETALPSGCTPVQIAYYTPEDRIKMDRQYWSLLTGQEKLALIFHEIYYYNARAAGAIDSIESRYVTAYLMSDEYEPMFKPLWSINHHLTCMVGKEGTYKRKSGKVDPASVYSFIAANGFVNGKPGLDIYFWMYDNVIEPVRTHAFIPDFDTTILKQDSSKQFNVSGYISSLIWRTDVRFELRRDADSPEIRFRTFGEDSAPPPFSTGYCSPSLYQDP